MVSLYLTRKRTQYPSEARPAPVISLKILYSSLQSFLKHILSQFVPPESLLSFLVLPRERFLFHLLSGSSSAASPVL